METIQQCEYQVESIDPRSKPKNFMEIHLFVSEKQASEV